MTGVILQHERSEHRLRIGISNELEKFRLKRCLSVFND